LRRGLPILAIVVTGSHFVVIALFPMIERRLPKSRWAPTSLQISYRDGQGVLREILSVCSQSEFSIGRVQVEGEHGRTRKQSGFQIGRGHDKDSYDEGLASEDDPSAGAVPTKGIVSVLMEVRGAKSIPKLAARLSEIPGVVRVHAGDVNFSSE
jgi:hypothetical protein